MSKTQPADLHANVPQLREQIKQRTTAVRQLRQWMSVLDRTVSQAILGSPDLSVMK